MTSGQTPNQALQSICQAVMSGDYTTAYSMVDLSEQIQMDSQTFDSIVDGASNCVWSDPHVSEDGMTADTYITFSWNTGKVKRWLVRMVDDLDGVWRLGVIT